MEHQPRPESQFAPDQAILVANSAFFAWRFAEAGKILEDSQAAYPNDELNIDAQLRTRAAIIAGTAYQKPLDFDAHAETLALLARAQPNPALANVKGQGPSYPYCIALEYIEVSEILCSNIDPRAQRQLRKKIDQQRQKLTRELDRSLKPPAMWRQLGRVARKRSTKG